MAAIFLDVLSDIFVFVLYFVWNCHLFVGIQHSFDIVGAIDNLIGLNPRILTEMLLFS